MCGIAGTVNYESSFVDTMLTSLNHRGPDDFGIIRDKDICLGHTRLKVIDLSPRGAQPMSKGRYTLTYNGEIYNFQELKQYIEINDDLGTANFYGNDAQTLLNYIYEFGIARALKDINGMYAFALYDRVAQKLHLVVDRLGQKPLYYYHTGSKFAFASTPAALTHLRETWDINRDALNSYWALGSVIGSDSLFDGIKKLCAGRILTYDVQSGALTTSKYWSPTFQTKTTEIEELVIDSIKKVLVADVPVNIFLSGGVDSSLVATQCTGMGAIHLQSPEIDFARVAARMFRINLNVVEPDFKEFESYSNDFVLKSGEPSMAGLIPYVTARAAKEFCTVAITANGADELFGGYDRTTDTVTSLQVNHILRSGGPIPIDLLGPEYMIDDKDISIGRWFELMTYVQFDLNKTLDFASMCHSLEVRAPFLDHRLVECALSIPLSKHRDAQYGNKAILKRMLSKFGFDKNFLMRPKIGFSLYKEPAFFEWQRESAFNWAIKSGWFHGKYNNHSGRDVKYLRASAYAFQHWFNVWKSKLNV